MSDTAPTPKRSHTAITLRMLAAAIGMFGFGYLMVPLYDVICDVTGLNGKTGRVSAAEAEQAVVAEDREIIVEFTATVNAGGSWVFRPSEKEMVVKPGQTYQTSYFAENLTNRRVVAQATPSVSPATASRFFNKTECFCFTRQEFEPGGSRDMPLTFIIDPAVPVNVDRVTLSYTFFNAADQS